MKSEGKNMNELKITKRIHTIKRYLNQHFFFITVFIFTFLLVGCIPQDGQKVPPQNVISYSVGNCYNPENITNLFDYEKTNIDVKTVFHEDQITVRQVLSYNCCAEISVDYEIIGKKLTLYDANKGTLCNCFCTREIYADVTASNISIISIVGVGFEQSKGILLYQETKE